MLIMKLSEHFSLQELIKTSTGIKNIPNDEELLNLSELCNKLLEPIRLKYNKPIIISSGFRNKEVNKKVGGVSNSYHLYGIAADIVVDDIYLLWDIINEMISKKEIVVGELLFEQNKKSMWIHISLPTDKKINYIKKIII